MTPCALPQAHSSFVSADFVGYLISFINEVIENKTGLAFSIEPQLTSPLGRSRLVITNNYNKKSVLKTRRRKNIYKIIYSAVLYCVKRGRKELKIKVRPAG